jgi:putative hemolysin
LDLDWQIKLLFLFILFIFSAFFSGSEVSLFSLNRRNILINNNSNSLKIRYLLTLIDNPRRLLVTILTGNTIVNVAASITAVSIALEIASNAGIGEDYALSVQIVLLTILVIFFGELIPKVIATKNPLKFAKIVSIPLYITYTILYPVAETLTEAIKIFTAKIKFSKKSSAILSEDISELASISHERGTIIEEEHEIIQSIVSFKTVTADEVMTPRVDMATISDESTFKEIVNVIISSGHSRIPVYHKDLDEIIGILYAKDLLPYIKNPAKQDDLKLSVISRRPLFVPKSKKISDLLLEFQQKKMHLAIVVDEYGGTAGLVSLEDLIEEIIGEIRDEYDREENIYTQLEDYRYMVLGKMSIHDLNELLNTEISTEEGEFETVAGLVLNNAGNIPREGYSFQINDWKFSVKEVLNKRIKKVLVEKVLLK